MSGVGHANQTNDTHNRSTIDWNGPIQVAIVAGIILGANIPFFIMSRNDTQTVRQEALAANARIETQIIAIHDEIKDFHTRLVAIEERRNRCFEE